MRVVLLVRIMVSVMMTIDLRDGRLLDFGIDLDGCGRLTLLTLRKEEREVI
jgi:hypothetical protein